MNIIQYPNIFKKYFDPIKDGFVRTSQGISEIIIHGTGGGQSAKAILNWMEGGERAEEYKKGVALFHYEIDRNGDIYQIMPDIYWCFHSSSGFHEPIHDRQTIGIELVNPAIDNHGGYELLQYKALFDLIKSLMLKYKIITIAGHGATKLKYSGSYKNCPGEKFNWVAVIDNFNLQAIGKEIYEVIT